ncbi:MAG: crosslink repair DNA glycosylase YcaQ family protein [Bacteroidota bacterium]
MTTQTLSQKHARRLALKAQALLKPNPFGKGKQAVQKAVNQLSYVQIDTISVIERAHLHVLRTRVSNFQPEMLDQLVSKDRSTFEYWSHAAAYLPMEDYRYSLPRKQSIKNGENSWFRQPPKEMAEVLARIQAEGPLRSKDFATKAKRSGEWWDWKPAKQALEQLFHEGELMIAERKGFQKVYDLPERVLPNWVDTSFPTEDEMARHLIERCLQNRAFASLKEIGYLRKGYRNLLKKTLAGMVEAGEIEAIQIDGASDEYYAFPATLSRSVPRIGKKRATLLSPFDNIIIQRKRLAMLFDYWYQIECYVPAPKRKYGYFVLPILFGDQLVGRLDPKADRNKQILYIRKLWIEPNFDDFDTLAPSLALSLLELANFNGCKEIKIEWSEVPHLQDLVEKEFQQH